MDDAGTIITVNNAFTESFGYLPDDVQGKHMSVLFTKDAKKKLQSIQEINRVLQAGYALDNHYLVCKNNAVKLVSGESIVINNGDGSPRILKILHHIQPRKTWEQFTEDSNDLNENILSTVADALVFLDKELNIIKANRSFIELFQHYFSGNLPDNFAGLAKRSEAFKLIQDNIQEAINSGKSCNRQVVEADIASGEIKAFDVSCDFLKNIDEGNNIMVVLHDVTFYKHLDREREDAIAFVVHELRNPLSNLMLVSDLITETVREKEPEQIEDLLQRNKKNILRLDKMVKELYDAVTVNSGNLIAAFSVFNFEEMINEAIANAEAADPVRKIVATGDGNIMIAGDRYRLMQVVTNYLGNAIKYSDAGTEVVLQMKYDDDTVTVKVTDEGAGISEKNLPLVFNRFFRGEKITRKEGIGLGLYLSRKIIHAHKGKVWAESEEGKGSSFYFSIPRHQQAG